MTAQALMGLLNGSGEIRTHGTLSRTHTFQAPRARRFSVRPHAERASYSGSNARRIANKSADNHDPRTTRVPAAQTFRASCSVQEVAALARRVAVAYQPTSAANDGASR